MSSVASHVVMPPKCSVSVPESLPLMSLVIVAALSSGRVTAVELRESRPSALFDRIPPDLGIQSVEVVKAGWSTSTPPSGRRSIALAWVPSGRRAGAPPIQRVGHHRHAKSGAVTFTPMVFVPTVRYGTCRDKVFGAGERIVLQLLSPVASTTATVALAWRRSTPPYGPAPQRRDPPIPSTRWSQHQNSGKTHMAHIAPRAPARAYRAPDARDSERRVHGRGGRPAPEHTPPRPGSAGSARRAAQASSHAAAARLSQPTGRSRG